jgi:hypothetical protein
MKKPSSRILTNPSAARRASQVRKTGPKNVTIAVGKEITATRPVKPVTSNTVCDVLEKIACGHEMETRITSLDDSDLQQLALHLEGEAWEVRSILFRRTHTNASPTAELFAPLLELDNAVDGASALLEMLAEKVVEQRNELGRSDSDEINRGFGELARSSIGQLSKALSGVAATFTAKLAPLHSTRAKGGTR